MGLLAVDIAAFGVVMSADSQRVEILGGRNAVATLPGPWSRNPIVQRRAGGFTGLIGSVGTEEIEGRPAAEWLRRFNSTHPADDLSTFCDRLRRALTLAWKQKRPKTVLEILIAGEIAGDLQFWYVRNSQGLLANGSHASPGSTFAAENDLDRNYIPRDARPKESKLDVLQRTLYSFRQGVLLPASPVFDWFSSLMGQIYASGIPGFAPIASLDDLGHVTRVRMEFLKRLCSGKHGIHSPAVPSPIGGAVHVLGVTPNGEIRDYSKQTMRVVLPGRATP